MRYAKGIKKTTIVAIVVLLHWEIKNLHRATQAGEGYGRNLYVERRATSRSPNCTRWWFSATQHDKSRRAIVP
jgi:hypothetical protein